MTKPTATLLLDRRALSSLLDMDEYIDLVEHAFELHGQGGVARPGLLHIDSLGGQFHIKAGTFDGARPVLATKVNGRFDGNGRGSNGTGAPTMYGSILVCDARTGYPLALMDSMEITSRRTGAATAVAAKRLARPDSSVVTICGAGAQARAQLRAIVRVLPLERAYVWARDGVAAERVAEEMSTELSLEVVPVSVLESAVRESDVCVTCTSATEFYLYRDYVPRGQFIAAVGADSPGKQELDPRLLGEARVVVDVLEQCREVGELQHVLRSGAVGMEDVHAELGQIVAGLLPGRESRDEITVFDSTGTAFQDAAVAGAAFQRAVETGAGTHFDFFAA